MLVFTKKEKKQSDRTQNVVENNCWQNSGSRRSHDIHEK